MVAFPNAKQSCTISRTIHNLAFLLSLQVTNRRAKDLPEMVIEAKDANVAEDVCEMGRVPRALEEGIAAHKQLGCVVLKDGREHFVKVRLVLYKSAQSSQ
jgi:hypothetical protein